MTYKEKMSSNRELKLTKHISNHIQYQCKPTVAVNPTEMTSQRVC